ncbi:MAG: dual specificity protein phosphatase [Anaerolineae bacterium]
MIRIRDWLFIGKYRDTTALALLRSYHVGAMLQLAEYVLQPNIATLYLNVEDGQPLPHEQLARGIAFVRAQKAQGSTVLIACGAGISRSAAFTMAALHEEEHLSLIDAYQQIVREHPDAMPHPKLLESLREYYHERLKFKDLWNEMIQVQRGA